VSFGKEGQIHDGAEEAKKEKPPRKVELRQKKAAERGRGT
jgi:hypothetical protein